MLQEKVALILQGIDASDRGDADAFVACLHPEVEWEESGDPFPGLRGKALEAAGLRE
jgi:ketosteroid isomerase-like protein